MTVHARRWVACVLLALAASAGAQGQAGRPVRIVVGFPPGGGIDFVARLLAPRLAEALGQPFVVDNRPGANGLIATELVARAPPDGHTILIGTTGNLSVNPTLYPDTPFSVGRDLAPVTQTSSVPFLLYLYPGVAATTLSELLALARASPGRVNYYSSGTGGLPHLAGELLNMTSGVRTVHVPYKGSAPGLNDLLGGHVQFGFDAVAIGLQHVKAGRLKALASTGPARLTGLPEVPAAGEILPGFEVVNWYGMVLPSGTARDVIGRLHAEVVKAMAQSDVREKLIAQGADPVGSTPEQFGAFMRAETVKWARVVKAGNIRPD